MAFSSIAITFNQKLSGGANLYIETGTAITILAQWVDPVTAANQVVVGSSTANVGETEAINFVTAFNAGINTALNYTVTRSVNVVTITSTGYNVFANASVSNSIWNEFIGWVIPPGETLTFYDVVFAIDNQIDPGTPEPEPEIINPLIITGFNIDIIDTTDNNLPLVLEKTEVKSPKLVYKGSDDKFQTIMASQLQFNMLVAGAQDGMFLHLFAGSETKYKVQLTDDEAVPNVIWQGYLLPEQFSEPYENGCFFVNFLASDGIGRLKGKYLPAAFYEGEQTIPKILAECLKLTGNLLNLYIAPAIKNALVSLKTADISINTISYIKQQKGKDAIKKDAYYILSELLKSIGCKIVQYYGRWFVIGINRFKDVSVVFEKYDVDGVYVSGAVLNRSVANAVFEANPELSISPPLKKVVVDWQSNYDVQIIDSNKVDQQFNIDNELAVLDYWSIIGGISYYNGMDVQAQENFGITLDGIELLGNVANYLEYKASINQPATFYVNLSGWVNDNTNKYIELINDVYVSGDLYGGKSVNFQLEFEGFGYTSLADISAANPYKYELLLDGNVIASNADLFAKIEYSFAGSSATLKGVVSVTNLTIPVDGYLSFRFYAPMPTENGLYFKSRSVTIKKIDITLNNYKETPFVLNRNIDFTKRKEISVLHSADKFTNSNLKFIIDEKFNVETYDVLADSRRIEAVYSTYTQSYSGSGGGGCYRVTKYELSKSDYVFLKNLNSAYIFLKRAGVLMAIVFDYEFYEIGSAPRKFYFKAYQNNCAGAAPFLVTDELWVDIPFSTEVINDVVMLSDKWARFEQVEIVRHSEALVKVYHDSVKTNNFRILGNILGLKFPFDILQFDYLGVKQFMLTSLALDLSTGITDVVVIEQKQEDVQDYISE